MKPQKTPQQTIDKMVENGEMVAQCAIYGTVRTPEGEYVGYRFKKPYHNISHTYCPEALETQLYLIDGGY